MSERNWPPCVASPRGFFVVGLDRPKTADNVGGVMRAAHCFGADLIILAGSRVRRQASDTTQAWRHIPVIECADVFDALPYDCVPVAVDLVPGARSLESYQHPQRAAYIFGAEDATLGARVLDRCRDRLVIPSRFCLNLAAAVNIILYDRTAKICRSARVAA